MIRRQALIFVSSFLLLLLIGTLGYQLIEGWSTLDSLYMAVITLTTVGYGEVEPLSSAGKAFTIALIILGAGAAAVLLTSLYDLFLSEDFRDLLRTRRRQRMIDRLTDHVIVCGYGRMGRYVASHLDTSRFPLVVVERDEAVAAQCERDGHPVLCGNAADEEVLGRAGIDRARCLITAVDSDAEAIFIVLTARGLAPDLDIVARANNEDTEPKLERAGASRVILPYALSGHRMVSLISRPGVTEFLDVVVQSDELELRLEEIVIQADSPVAGRTLAEIDSRKRHGVTVLAMYNPGEKRLDFPDASSRLDVGTRLIVIGTDEGLDGFEAAAKGRAS